MLAAALMFGQVARRFGQPTVLGELVGGIFLGPTVLKSFFPSLFKYFFPTNTTITPEINSFIQLGMLLFMFVTGLEVNLGLVWKKRSHVLYTSLFGIFIPLCLGIGMALFFPWRQDQVTGVNKWIFVLFIGTALSISALPVILKTLVDCYAM
jgi:Kef-type K+ transport system membrane component KefB